MKGMPPNHVRVLHVAATCGHGGVETLLATLVRCQQTQGIQADVFFLRDCGGAQRFEGLCRPRFGDWGVLAGVLKAGDCNVVHAATYTASDLARSLEASKYPGAVVLTSHECQVYPHDLHYDCVTAVSAAVARSIQGYYSLRVQVIHNGVDIDRFAPGSVPYDGKPIMAWIGRADDPMKDFSAFLALANRPVSDRFRVIVVDGSAEDKSNTEWLPTDCEVRRRVPWQQMPEFYRLIRGSGGLLISTSKEEPFGLNVLEAMACGCPVVAPASGGIPEFVRHKETGYLYDRVDGIDAMEAGIDWIYAGDNYLEVSQSAATYVVLSHSAERMCSEYSDVYERALALRAKTKPRSKTAGARHAWGGMKFLSGKGRHSD